MENLERRHIIHLAIITLSILILVPGLSFLISEITNLQFFPVTNLTSAFGTILLSAVLAYLYFQMWSTQVERTSIHENQEEILDKQTEIQEKQHDIIQTGKKFLLDISHQEADGNDCYIHISNHGGGAVVELSIRTLLKVNNDQFSGERTITQLRRIEQDGTKGGKIIGPNEKSVKIGCCPQFHIHINEAETEGDFSEMSTHLSNNRINKVQLEMHFIATDEFGNSAEETLIDDSIGIHPNMGLAEVGGWENS